MTMNQTFAPAQTAAIDGVARNDNSMLRAAAELTRDLNVPSASIYWVDLMASAIIGYAALATAMLASLWSVALVAGVVAILALFRAGSFIHELTPHQAGRASRLQAFLESGGRDTIACAILFV